MAQYVAAYGARATMFVAVEKYTQRVGGETGGSSTPVRLVSEFALVKAGSGENWIGYRDVFEVNGKAVADRQDRLLGLLTSASADGAQLRQLADESARYNLGPISRNVNVPTTALLFFHPSTIGRFSFVEKGTRDIDGVATWELEFTETKRPTLIRTREGRDAPCEGRVWVAPGEGTVVRTRLELRHFSDQPAMRPVDSGTMRAPPTQPPMDAVSAGVTLAVPALPPSRTGSAMTGRLESALVESRAQIDVSYRFDKRLGVWLPLKMSELYEGAMPSTKGRGAVLGRTMGVAEYSGFRRFETSAKIVFPK